MSLLSFFNRRTSAPVARERLQILLAHERGVVGGKPDLVSQLREEILAVVRRHVMVEQVVKDAFEVVENLGRELDA